ncbi:MAG: hypothetical protein U0N10_06575 [Bacilli bacterium]
MKRYFILIVSLLIIFMVSGCSNSKENKDDLSIYEYHYYDKDFEHTEDFIVKYDKDGKLKSLESIYVYDKRTDSKYCKNAYPKDEYIDLTYKDVYASCTVDENGQKLISSMTDKSIEDGYLVDDKDYRLVLQYIYEDVSTEKDAINFFKKMEATFKEENSSTDERNYLIVKGKRVNFD